MGLFTYNIKQEGEGRGAGDKKDMEAFARLKEGLNGKLNSENVEVGGLKGTNLAEGTIERKQLAAEAKPITWYAPKVIATEESRENAAFGKLATPDEITGVVLPTNGLMLVSYRALMRGSANAVESSIADAAIFIGANQLKEQHETAAAAQMASIIDGPGVDTTGRFESLYTTMNGLAVTKSSEWYGAFVTTGMPVGFCLVEAAAGTYAISVQFKAPSGSVTAKERKLWVATLG